MNRSPLLMKLLLLPVAAWLPVLAPGRLGAEVPRVQAAAYYFPCWHRVPGQVGESFGEWAALETAKPRFSGHEQPKQPLWGMQDESDPAVMAQKIDAAADHGLSAFVFCWYYYSGSGSYLDAALNAGYRHAVNRTRLPYALMWANADVPTQPPRRGSLGREDFEAMGDLLVKEHFRDPHYWRPDGRCYFSIYQPLTFIRGLGGEAAARAALDALRVKARAAGAGELHVNLIDLQLQSLPNSMQPLLDLGADSITSYCWAQDAATERRMREPTADYAEIRDTYFGTWDRWWSRSRVHLPNVTMGWDPTPRLAAGLPHTGKAGYPDTAVLTGGTPERFESALRMARERATRLPTGMRIVTLYAWNEWTEGGYLEPEARHGMAYLEAVKRVFAPAADSLSKDKLPSR
jgi:hypothetical protein